MSSSVDLPSADNFPSVSLAETHYFKEAQCGKLGFSVVCINTVALSIFALNLAVYGTLLGAVSLACSAVVLPSMALFGVNNYLHYITKPIEMGLGFALAFFTVKVDPETGVWEGARADWAHFYDGRLSRALSDFFQNEGAQSIVDLGCGTGDYVKDLRNTGLQADGYDGNPDTPKLTGNVCGVADLTTPNLPLGREKYDWVFSLEVGEHLPKQHEDTFLQNVVNHAEKGIVLSWAKKGQGGLGHVNEQNNEYIQGKMSELGWKRDFEAEEGLRLSTSPHCFWFRDTIMVYRPTTNNPQG